MSRDDLAQLIGENLREIGGYLDWLDNQNVVDPVGTGEALQALVNARYYLDLLVKA